MDDLEYENQLDELETRLENLQALMLKHDERIHFLELLLYQLYHTFPEDVFPVKKMLATFIKASMKFELKVRAEAAEVFEVEIIDKETGKRTVDKIDEKQKYKDKLKELENIPPEQAAQEWWEEWMKKKWLIS